MAKAPVAVPDATSANASPLRTPPVNLRTYLSPRPGRPVFIGFGMEVGIEHCHPGHDSHRQSAAPCRVTDCFRTGGVVDPKAAFAFLVNEALEPGHRQLAINRQHLLAGGRTLWIGSEREPLVEGPLDEVPWHSITFLVARSGPDKERLSVPVRCRIGRIAQIGFWSA